ncbi:LysR family transcriptional regulator [Mycobacterium sp. ITM-2016-00317]|uniref:LysR family transcriptional regulator n=1 Tax=Mycobacterium sp. ITM-2016-00317 TaxID=2099694 RepID=UPI00287F907C|nr:LysR family transcriptional regulator [Mycobacterium sp. ITM-2016-00317]WNG87528.1 LysR family transcriptional regulator [Mycobacterium sp. ITM-2016-00317]
MQLRHVETFLAILDAGTLTAASARLYKTQAAVSQDLKALESGLGLELIDRSGQRVTLTEAGRAFAPMARRLLAEVAATESEMARIRAGERPVVRIGCLPSLGSRMCALVSAYAASRPGTRWSVITALRGALVEGVRRAQYDVVVCEAQAEDEITNVPLTREELRVVLPATHPLAGAGVVGPDDLVGLPYIGLARGMGATVEAQRFFASGGNQPAPLVEVSDTRLVLELVGRLGGFGVVPVSALDESPRSVDHAIAAAATDPPMVRQLSLTHLAGRTLPAIVHDFADHVVRDWHRSAR